MPSILPRRRASQRAQPVDQSTTYNAAAAATSAFLQTSKSTSSLSSAAAAAALRSHTTSPESVGSLQTKRMVRRGSTSSNGSGVGARGGIARPGLQRSNSSGSMTERTFRASSPAEPDRRTMSLDSRAPPIPPIPANAHQRTSSLDRTLRVTSPTTSGRGGDRISSPPPTTSKLTKRLSNVTEREEADARPASPVSPPSPSRNFSRPMSSQANIPVIGGASKRYTHGTGSWYTQPSSSTSTPARPMTAEGTYRSLGPPLDLSSVANRPVSKNRISSAPGSHLARTNHSQARSFSGPSSMSDEDDDSAVVFDKHTRTFIRTSRSRTVEPSSPDSPRAPQVVYDPHTRSLVSSQEGRENDSGFTVTPVQQDRVSSPEHRPRIYQSIEYEDDPALRPPPRNPARLSPDPTSPTSPRTPQLLHKQPSVVREDSEAERNAEALDATPSESRHLPQPVVVTAGPPKTYVAPTTPHQRSASLEPPPTTSAGRGRDASASPSRSPHFSSSPILRAARHEPPPRGVSPVKSALKYSPASSVRTASPIANFSPPVAASTSTVSPPSEISEGTPSQDGLDSSKKRKSVRVSFDEHAREIEAPATATVPVATPSFEEEDDDAVMKPRPALPSFGSIRRNRVQPEMAEKVTEMPPERHEASSDHAIGGILRNSLEPLPPEVTSKESAGYASDESSEIEVPAVSAAANPKPAEVGAGLESGREGSEPIIKDFAEARPAEDTNKRDAEDVDVPAINLLPPTPRIEDESKKDLSDQENGHEDLADQDDSFETRAKARNSTEIVVPGSWGEDDDEKEDVQAEEPSKSALDQQTSSADQSDTLSPILHASPLQLSDIDEDSDDSAEFSDAVEDPEDLDDGGFASLDAIVESPMVPHSPADIKGKSRTTQEPPESPTVQPGTKKAENADPNITGNWGEATAYWSQLSKEKREQIERQHMSSDDDERPAPKPIATRTATTTKPTLNTTVTVPPVARTSKQPSTVQREPAQPTMRKTMRAQTGPAPVSTPSDDGSVHMRRSMRSGGSMSPSLRSGGPPRRPQSEYVEPRGTLQKKNLRPMSSTGTASSSSGSMLQTQRPSSASGPKTQDSSFPTLPTSKSSTQRRTEPPQVSARLQRELAKADDSDSESSFKRRRRGNSGSTVDSTNKYTMRRSMRGASVDETPTPREQRPQSPDVGDRSKSGFRLRSLSPPSLFGRKKAEATPTPTGPRTTMRTAPAAKSGGGKAAPPSRTAPPATPRYKSRFADSDDSDDDAAPSRSFFKSRFADSDDDEPGSPPVPSGLTPVRGIPRRPGQDDGDSTDLEDEDDDVPGKAPKSRRKVAPMVTDSAEVEKAMAAARRNLGISEEPAPKIHPTTEGSALAKGSLRGKPDEVKEDKPVAAPTAPPPESPVVGTPKKEKRGFMNTILRRNRNSTSSVQQLRTTSPPPALPTSPATAVKTSPTDDKQASPDSPTSPSVGKLLRRRSDQPEMARLNSDYSTATAQPTSQATTAVAPQNDEAWPLPSPSIPPVPPIPADLAANAATRPDTSDGFSPEAVKLARTMRPDLAPRSKSGPQRSVRIQAGEEGSEPGEREKDQKTIYSRRTGKKKKFGMLRRAFGIED